MLKTAKYIKKVKACDKQSQSRDFNLGVAEQALKMSPSCFSSFHSI